MNLEHLSKAELVENLRDLQRSGSSSPNEDISHLQEAVHELQVQRVEMEMQNRALRETRQELEQSLQRYADLYDHLPIGYITVTPEGEIVEANVAATEVFQRERGKLRGSLMRSFVDAYDAGRLAAHLEACGKSGRDATIELTLRLGNGGSKSVQLISRVMTGSHDQARSIHLAITDVSKLKDAQRVLEEINREQETFNYSISHDLRAPLVTITNYARIVLAEHAANLDEEGRSMVQRMESAALRMEQTLKHLLAYASLAREEVVLQTINTEEVVHELLIEHRGIIERAEADILIERPLPDVRGSKLMLNQVLANLLTNALKYTTPGEPPRVRISGDIQGANVVLKVADQGIGIEPKFHERVFQIFERLHGYSRYPGSGVGLAIARRAMERMNGRIWVESELGRGSCFCLELPKA